METQTIAAPEGPAFAHPRAEVLYSDKTGIRKINTRVTVAYRTVGSDLEYAVAFTSPRDNFSRGIGRQIASGRLRSAPFRITPLTLENPVNTILGDVVANRLPTRWVNANLTTSN
jgi:hypothetical protein